MNRYFKSTDPKPTLWFFNGEKMLICDECGEWDDSICSVHDLQTALDTVECDEDYEPLKPSAEDIAAEKGDRAFKLAQEENA